MRSNDVIRGFSIDVVMFSYIYEMLYLQLKEIYPELKIGTYYHNADSFHIYELHYPMMESILANNGQNYTKISVPRMTLDDVKYLRNDFLKHEEHLRCDPNKGEFPNLKNKLSSKNLKFSKYVLKNLL
jgi:thymidylate synthase